MKFIKILILLILIFNCKTKVEKKSEYELVAFKDQEKTETKTFLLSSISEDEYYIMYVKLQDGYVFYKQRSDQCIIHESKEGVPKISAEYRKYGDGGDQLDIYTNTYKKQYLHIYIPKDSIKNIIKKGKYENFIN